MVVTAANVHDSLLFEALLDDLPAVVTPSGQRRCRPGKVWADKGYDHSRCQRYLAARRITSRIARRGIESSGRLGRYRWKVERSLAWLGCYQRLGVRWERCAGRFFRFYVLACSLLCFNTLQRHHF